MIQWVLLFIVFLFMWLIMWDVVVGGTAFVPIVLAAATTFTLRWLVNAS